LKKYWKFGRKKYEYKLVGQNFWHIFRYDSGGGGGVGIEFISSLGLIIARGQAEKS